MLERRGEERAEVNTVAVVLARHNPGVTMTIESLSLGGARLAGPGTFDKGERIHILFEVDMKPLEVLGEVIRVEHHDITIDRIAVRFVSLDDPHRAAIQRLIRQTLALEAMRFAPARDD